MSPIWPRSTLARDCASKPSNIGLLRNQFPQDPRHRPVADRHAVEEQDRPGTDASDQHKQNHMAQTTQDITRKAVYVAGGDRFTCAYWLSKIQ